ncbi:MAG: AAA family ATPase [Calditrichaeota bacterium]|nr:AAA family ATPase [Calditrichota bacterium]
MNTNNQVYQFDFENLISILKRKRWLVIVSVIIALALGALYIWKTKPAYRAQATIVFEQHQGPVSLISPFQTTLPATFITNQIEEIKSRAMAEEVTRKLPPGILMTIPLPEKRDKLFDRNEYLASEIQRHISATPVPNSEVIKITAEANSSIAAKVIANTVADVFQKRNLQVRREETSNVRQIIEDQLAMFKNRLDSAEIALKQFKERSNVTVIDKEAEEIFKRITEAEILYNKTKANLDATQRRFSFIKTKLAQERKDLVPSITEISSPWAKKLKEQLVDLQSQYTKLKLQNYDENHPKILDLKRQIEQTKKNLKAESLKIASGENIVDPITQIQRYLEELVSLEVEIQAYQAQVHTLQSVIASYKRNLNTIPDKELRLAKLLRDKEVNEKIYTMLLNKREEARIAEAEKVGNIRILDPAKTPRSPYKPQKKLIAFVALVFGLTFGIGMAFLLEALDTTLKTPEETERAIGLKVLAEIPEIEPDAALSRDKYYKAKERRSSFEIVRRLITSQAPESFDADAFRGLTVNLRLVNMDSPLKTILITSSIPKEGKSLIAANLSINAANMGMKTLLIDADVMSPVQHQIFKQKKSPGLINLIAVIKTNMVNQTNPEMAKTSPNNGKQTKVIDTVEDFGPFNERLGALDYIFSHNSEFIRAQNKKIISSTGMPNLDLLSSGSSSYHFSDFLASRILRNIFFELEKQYDAIFIDTAPICVSTIARLMSSVADGVLLIARAGKTPRKEIITAQKTLERVDANVIGVVLNDTERNEQFRKYQRYYQKATTI